LAAADHFRQGKARTSARGRRLRVETLEDRRMLAVDLQLVGDFNLQPTSALPSSFLPSLVNTSNITPVGEVVYFTASTFDHGNELWKSDGTAEGTVLVKDIIPGPTGSQYRHFEAVGDTLYFQAISPTTGVPELWKSDGTEAGTMVVRFHDAGGPWSPYNLTNVDGKLFFIGMTPANGRELWTSDGTAAGTVMVKDIVTGFGDAFADFNLGPISTATPLPYFTAVGSTLYFIATNQSSYSSGRELWKSDGTAAGTVVVKDIRSGSPGTFDLSQPDPQLTAVGDTLYFVAADLTNGAELWKTDGSEMGTVMVKNITPGGGSTFFSTTHKLVNFAGSLYFTRAAAVSMTQLWTSDGSSGGTQMVVEFQATNANELTVAGERMYFSASSPGVQLSLWSSNGTALGTAKVRNFSASSFPATLGLVASGDAVYFSTQDFAGGYELWKSDGTLTGTAILRDIYPGTRSSNPVGLADAEGTLYFAADDGAHGFELWATDGSFATTRLVRDIREGTASFSLLSGYAELNGMLLFAGNNGVTGTELWRTDGTAAGTQLVANLRPGSQSSYPFYFKRFGSSVYFVSANTEFSTTELWRTDGTGPGTVRLANISEYLQSQPFFTELNGALYLRGRIGESGAELLRIDDTGLSLVKDIRPGPDASAPSWLTVAGGKLFFAADVYPYGNELWVSDGTEAGTMLVKDIRPDSLGSLDIPYAVEVDGLLYFAADDGEHGRELWRSDGTADGTVMVADLHAESSEVHGLVNVAGTLYFKATDGVTGWQIWKLAPGAAAPEPLKPIGDGTFTPGSLVNVNGMLFFTAVDEEHGRELWKSDGTEAGTVLVKDIVAGPNSLSAFVPLVTIGGTLYFSVDDGIHGQELWSSDGTEEGTQLVADLATGLASSYPAVAALGGLLIVQATTGPYGAEFWSAALTPSVAGDYDFNGAVNGNDFLAWQRGLGSTVSPAGSGADGDESGGVDAGDLDVWRGIVGAAVAISTTSASAAVVAADEDDSAGEPAATIAAADAAFAAGDFTRLFAAASEVGGSRSRHYRPRRRF
jgi:ELWxxDGT repeat protein